MPAQPSKTPRPSLEAAIDLSDDVEVERVTVARISHLLSAHSLQASSMPPGRHAWFEGFLRRSVEGALMRSDRKWLNHHWDSFEGDLVTEGIVPTVVKTLRRAYDPDGKEELRGHADHAADTVEMFLGDRCDVREILDSAIEARDPALWQQYPAWFGDVTWRGAELIGEVVNRYRIRAVRFLPIIDRPSAELSPLLDDPTQEVRHVAAVRLAQLDEEANDDRLLTCLLDAAADEKWIWSWQDEFASDWTGQREALSMLERFGSRAKAAVPILETQIAAFNASRDDDSYQWHHPWVDEARRLIEVFDTGRVAK